MFPDAKHDLLDLDSLLSPTAKLTRDKTRAFMVIIFHVPTPVFMNALLPVFVAASAGMARVCASASAVLSSGMCINQLSNC